MLDYSHPHERIGVVYKGKARLKIGEEGRIVQQGDFYCIPANTTHGDTCLSEDPFVMLDIFSPIRGLYYQTEVIFFEPRLIYIDLIIFSFK